MVLHRNQIEDLTNRANRNVWGSTCVYTPKGGAPISIDANGDPLIGVFDSAHAVTFDGVDGGPISDRAPMLELALDDIEGLFVPAPGDKFDITGPAGSPHVGETYTVHEPQFDSAQAVVLICTKGDHSA